MSVTPAMLDALDKAGPDARKAFFARRTPEERQALAEAIPKWRESQPSELASGALGGLQGVSLGFADEMEGLAGALANKVGGGEFDYTERRDKARERYAEAERVNPKSFTAGRVVGGVGGVLLPGGAAAKTLKGAMALGAATGAAQGLGESEADLTEGEVGEAAKDAVVGGAVGAGAGAIGHGASRAAGALANRAKQGVRVADADLGAEEYAARYATKKSAEGAVGGEAAAGLNALAKAEEVVANTAGHYGPQELAQAQRFLASPKAGEIRRRAAGNVLDRGEGRLAGSLVDAERQMGAAHAAMDPAAVAAGAEARGAGALRKQLAPRVWTLGHRLLPVMLTAAGGAVGGAEGAGVGAGLGGIMALTQGRPGIIIRNAIRSPGVRKSVWEFAQAAAESEGLGRFGRMLLRALQQEGVRGALALHESLLEAQPEYGAELERAILETGGEE